MSWIPEANILKITMTDERGTFHRVCFNTWMGFNLQTLQGDLHSIMIMLLVKREFKAAEAKSTRSIKSTLRDAAVTTVLLVTPN